LHSNTSQHNNIKLATGEGWRTPVIRVTRRRKAAVTSVHQMKESSCDPGHLEKESSCNPVTRRRKGAVIEVIRGKTEELGAM
jgi:hypothetical protein